MANDVNVKLKNDQPGGAALKLQFWNGALPVYNSDAQKAAALASAVAVDVDAKAAETGGAPVETLPENYKKLNKAELVALLVSRKEAGHHVELDDQDTVPVIKAKIEATYPAVEAGEEVVAQNVAAAASLVPDYSFSASNLLQEIELLSGEEKVFGINDSVFLTIQVSK